MSLRAKKVISIFLVSIAVLLLATGFAGRALPSLGARFARSANAPAAASVPLPDECLKRQGWNQCAQYSAAAVIASISGTRPDPDELDRETPWRLPNRMTLPWGLVDLLRDRGIEVEEVVAYALDADAKTGLLRNAIDVGRPAILLGRAHGVLHYVTVFAYDRRGFSIYDSMAPRMSEDGGRTVDSNGEAPGNAYLTDSELLSLWDQGGVGPFFVSWAALCGPANR